MDSEQSQKQRLFLARWLFSPLAGVTLGPWWKILRSYGHTIPPRYWPRALFTTGMAAMNSILKRREDTTYLDNAYRVEQPIFILGHHRSGTTHLWKLLATDQTFIHPTVTETIFPDTLLTFENIASRWARRLAPGKRPQDNVRNTSSSPMGEEWALCTSTFLSTHMARHFPRHRENFKRYLTLRDLDPAEQRRWQLALDDFARKLLYKNGGRGRLLFKAPTHTAKVRLLLDLYPDARFIHIQRDPYRVFQSSRHMELESLPMCAYQHWHPASVDPYVLWHYREMYDAFFDDLRSIPPGQISWVRYEDLVCDRIGTVERIYRELDLPGFGRMKPRLSEYIDSIADYRGNEFAPLGQDEKAAINDAWGDIIQRLGYEPAR